jgi:hypothetical protein
MLSNESRRSRGRKGKFEILTGICIRSDHSRFMLILPICGDASSEVTRQTSAPASARAPLQAAERRLPLAAEPVVRPQLQVEVLGRRWSTRGKSGESWNAAAEILRISASLEKWIDAVGAVWSLFGKLVT